MKMWWIIGIFAFYYCLTRKREGPFFRIVSIAIFIILVANLSNPWFWIVGILGGLMLIGYFPDGIWPSKKVIVQPIVTPVQIVAVPKAPVAKPPMPIATLQQFRSSIAGSQESLINLSFFDGQEADLDAAWKSKDAERIEGVLRAGDALNRASWKNAFDRFNAAIKSVDKARKALIDTIASAEATLKQYGVTADLSSVKRSKQSYGIAPTMNVHHNWASRINPNLSMGAFARSAGTGNMPWQLALPAMAIIAVVSLIGDSKLLRELKEAEGKLLTQSTEMQSDVSLMKTLFDSRILPQMDIIISSISAIRALLEPLQLAASTQQQEDVSNERAKQAALLSLAVAEAQHALKAMAGD
jgi:hypothetical protein